MESSELKPTPLYELALMIESGDVSPMDLVEVSLNRIQKTDDNLNAYISVAGEAARSAARASTDQIQYGNYLGVLHGIPYACKDIFLTKDIQMPV